MNNSQSQEIARGPRPYRQVLRTAATEMLQNRIAEAFLAALKDHWIADIRLDQVARAAGTTRQTVIRFFGSKEGLIEPAVALFRASVMSRRAFEGPVTPRKVADAALADYEVSGDFVIRLLAQEERFLELRSWLQVGRNYHREWIAKMFAPEIQYKSRNSDRLLNQFVVVYDVYTWKLLRRDFGLDTEDAALHMAEMAERLIKGE